MSTIQCNITFVSSTQIICQLQSAIVGDTKLPISISVDDVYTQTYKPHIFCDDRFYSTILFGGEYELVKQLMIDNVKMETTANAPYIGAFESKEMYQCFNQSLNLKGMVVSLDISNIKYYTPLITFYTSDTPIIDSVTNIQFGQPSMVTIKGNHFGKDQSYVLISIYGKQCKSPRFIGNSFKQITCLLDVVSNLLESSNITIRVAEKVVSRYLKQCPGNYYGICNERWKIRTHSW
ncbi:hypothetical protein DFA_00440 [Cavenderia fasciculata]|uniref:IPT/TIG domain-containing protein n=1 Tax=Cavenderia fasciculata TaxID=261658 RepID=F4PRT0_CACFS|nr:uncharacterized protein DFA_00440 [Cavenderia fasciculata]EGG20579.1 hypothetical protein DFA_00440 [Cavenderia fasciculata]|eukprot:XP_004358429.1 hypothetical protein DFA_00440 [Cavenderia fasciculata]